MILIADSGSTKCDWAVLEEDGTSFGLTDTPGLNPYFLDKSAISGLLIKNELLNSRAGEISRIFFYGAGCSSPGMCEIVESGLHDVFKSAHVVVDHDLLGSAMATYDGRPCISCILGTGSNACFFDGLNIYQEVPSLAYILGDEASGSYFGKILLREYFYKKLPADLRVDFEIDFRPDKTEVLRRVYKEAGPNTYLAGFMQFIVAHNHHSHVQRWIENGFREFLDIHVKSYSDWQNLPVHFVGSIGYLLREKLLQVCDGEGVKVGRIIQKPIDGLVDFHRKYRL